MGFPSFYLTAENFYEYRAGNLNQKAETAVNKTTDFRAFGEIRVEDHG